MNASEKPELPDVDGMPWCAETERWFKAWQDSPATDSWDGRQWQFLFDTALVHQSVWYDGDLSRIGELRARESYMGITFDQKPAKKNTDGKPTILQMVINDRAGKAKAAGGC